jgi:hypothetical protein
MPGRYVQYISHFLNKETSSKFTVLSVLHISPKIKSVFIKVVIILIIVQKMTKNKFVNWFQ